MHEMQKRENISYEEYLKVIRKEVAGEVIRLYRAYKPNIVFDVFAFTEEEKFSLLIKMKLVNYERKRELLEKIPHIKVLDLAVVFMANNFWIMLMSKIISEMTDGVLVQEDFRVMKEKMYLLSNYLKLQGAVGG